MDNQEPEVNGAMPEPSEDILGESGSKALAEERKYRRDAEKIAKSLQAKVSELEQSGKQSMDRLTEERDTLRLELDMALKRIADAEVRDSVLHAATSAGAVNAQVLYRYLRDDLVVDGGKVTNLEAAIKAAKKDAPHLFHATGNVDGGTPGSAPSPLDMNMAIRRKAGIAS